VIAAKVRTMCEGHGLRLGTHPENLAALRLHQWGHRFEQQHRAGAYRLDLAFPELRVAVEIDGPHHQRPDVAVRDAFRDQWLRDEGWLVFRVNAGDTLEAQLARVSEVLHVIRGGGHG